MVIPPKYAVSKVVETIKTNTSKALKLKFTFLNKEYIGMVKGYGQKVILFPQCE